MVQVTRAQADQENARALRLIKRSFPVQLLNEPAGTFFVERLEWRKTGLKKSRPA